MSPLVQPWPGLVWGSAVLCWTQVTSPNVHSSLPSLGTARWARWLLWTLGCRRHPAPLSRYLDIWWRGDERIVSWSRHAARPDQPRPGGERGEDAAGGGQARAHRAAGGGQLPRRSPGAGSLLFGCCKLGQPWEKPPISADYWILISYSVLMTARPRAVLTSSSAGLRAGPRQTPRPRRPHQPPRGRLPAGWRGPGEGQ